MTAATYSVRRLQNPRVHVRLYRYDRTFVLLCLTLAQQFSPPTNTSTPHQLICTPPLSRSCAARSVPPGPTDPQVPSRTAALPASDQRPHRTHAHPCRVTHHAGSSASIAASLTFGGRYKALCIGASEVDGPAFARADAHDAARGQRLTRPVRGLDHMHAAVQHVRRSREGLANVNRRHEAIANR